MAEIYPLYLDSFGNLVQAQSGDTLPFPVTAQVIEYANVLINTPAYTCCALVTATASPVNSTDVTDTLFRPKPFVDCLTLEYGNAGNRIQIAATHGKKYTIETTPYTESAVLYLGQNSKLTVVKPTLVNGDKWLVVVGRLVNDHEFIFHPQEPVDLEYLPDGLPSIEGQAGKFLSNDGSIILWDDIVVSGDGTLQGAYNGGSEIVTDTNDPVIITGNDITSSLFKVRNQANDILDVSANNKVTVQKMVGKEYSCNLIATVQAIASDVIIDQTDKTEYRGIKYTYTITNSDNSGYEFGDLYIIHNDNNASLSSVMMNAIGTSCGVSFTVNMNGNDINLLVTTDDSILYSRIIHLFKIAVS